MLIFIIFIILFVILFMPIPLKFTIHYSKDEYFLKFYNIDLFSNDDGFIRKILSKRKEKASSKDTVKKEKDYKSNKRKKLSEYINFREVPILMIYNALLKNKFKPSLKYKSNINYSLADAARTAIFFGVLNGTNPILYNLFKVIFRIKNFENKFNPVFKDKIIFEFTISSIITFNLAQIIYIAFIVFNCILKNKEVSLRREFYGR